MSESRFSRSVARQTLSLFLMAHFIWRKNLKGTRALLARVTVLPAPRPPRWPHQSDSSSSQSQHILTVQTQTNIIVISISLMTCLIIFEDDYHCFRIEQDEVF